MFHIVNVLERHGATLDYFGLPFQADRREIAAAANTMPLYLGRLNDDPSYATWGCVGGVTQQSG